MRRLDAALFLLPNSPVLADVGCDHGMLCKAAIETDKAGKVYACDISAASLDKARKALSCMNAEFFCCDGLKDVPKDFTALSICGMGGETIIGILGGYDGNAAVVLQPQTHCPDVRKYMTERGYALKKEVLALERGRYYPVMLFERGKCELDELQIFFGLNAHKPPAELVEMAERLIQEHEQYPKNPRSCEILRLARQVTGKAK